MLRLSRRQPIGSFDDSSLQWLGISDLIAEPEGPTFISRTVTQPPCGPALLVTQDPSCAFAPFPDPGRTDVPLPWRSHRCCPRLTRQRGLRTMHISGLTHAASAPALLRFALHVAARAQGWLPAGRLAFTGRASNPLDRYERFQIVRHSPFLAS
jgi:hypothetical protein